MLNRKPQKPSGKSRPLPEWLKLTHRRRVQIAEEQQLLRQQARARGRLSPEAQRVQLGIAHETAARTDVEMLEGETRRRRPEVRTSGPTRRERLKNARARLAEALAQQGRYDEAAAAAPTKEMKAEFAALHEAVWRDDDESCSCEAPKHPELALSHDHVAAEVYSQKHSRLMPAVGCNNCGFVNVKPLPHHLRVVADARSRMAMATEGHDAKTLKHKLREIAPEELTDRRLVGQ